MVILLAVALLGLILGAAGAWYFRGVTNWCPQHGCRMLCRHCQSQEAAFDRLRAR